MTSVSWMAYPESDALAQAVPLSLYSVVSEVAQFAKVPSGLVEPALQTAQMDIGQGSFTVAGGNEWFS